MCVLCQLLCASSGHGGLSDCNCVVCVFGLLCACVCVCEGICAGVCECVCVTAWVLLLYVVVLPCVCNCA